MSAEKPTIKAEFELDENQKPKFVLSGGRKHYKIRLLMERIPEDAHAVTYELHETYLDPVREVRREVPNFAETITSYGDYIVNAQVRRKKVSETSSSRLTQALKLSYGSDPPPPIRKAIEELRSG